MSEIRLACVVGARPNFTKMAPLMRALEAYSHVRAVLVHTGQHYDQRLSDVFFEELGIRRPDVSLGVGSGTHAQQTARVLEGLEGAIAEAEATLGKGCSVTHPAMTQNFICDVEE